METLYIESIPGFKEELIKRGNAGEDEFVSEDEVEWQMYKIEYNKKAVKDIQKLKQNKLDKKAKQLIDLIKTNPLQNPPPYEKLIGDLKQYYSRRINIQHRLVYKIDEKNKTVKILSMWTHYENIQPKGMIL